MTYSSHEAEARASRRVLRYLKSHNVETSLVSVAQALAESPHHIRENSKLIRRKHETGTKIEPLSHETLKGT